MPKNTTQCPQSGLEPEPLDPQASALTMRSLRLHFSNGTVRFFFDPITSTGTALIWDHFSYGFHGNSAGGRTAYDK